MDGGLIAFIVFACIIGGVVFIGFIGELVRKIRQANAQENSATNGASYATQPTTSSQPISMTQEQRQRLDYLRQQKQQRTDVDKHERHVADAHEHGHTGVEEHYEEIVGSLGDVNDEGCEDLSGVRFIAHDLAYDLSEGGEHDYTELAKAMVLGDIVNSPRFKTPYKRK